MKHKAATLLLACMLLAPGAAWARVTLYLYPVINNPGAELSLSDIARIESDRRGDQEIPGIRIDSSIYSDGFIDRTEILGLMKNKFDGCVMIVGSATRVSTSVEKNDTGDKAKASDIKQGDPVTFVYRKGLIRIELTGTALSNGCAGESIQVRLKKKRTATGRIIADRMVISEQ